jgi:hypothetical protein
LAAVFVQDTHDTSHRDTLADAGAIIDANSRTAPTLERSSFEVTAMMLEIRTSNLLG